MYEIDCRDVRSFEDLIAAFNIGFVGRVGGKWNGNFDALNDYLSWPDKYPYKLLVLGEEQCAAVLNFKVDERHDKNIWPLVKEVLLSNSDWAYVEFR